MAGQVLQCSLHCATNRNQLGRLLLWTEEATIQNRTAQYYQLGGTVFERQREQVLLVLENVVKCCQLRTFHPTAHTPHVGNGDDVNPKSLFAQDLVTIYTKRKLHSHTLATEHVLAQAGTKQPLLIHYQSHYSSAKKANRNQGSLNPNTWHRLF